MDGLKLCSYNCNSFKNNLNIIEKLMSSHDIILLQELMLLKEDSYLVKTLSDNWESILFVRDNLIDGILEGRPKKGCKYTLEKSFV